MKTLLKKIILFVCSILAALALICSCGSSLDGTWVSQADSKTKIQFSGNKVNVIYDGFKTSGTYETEEDGNITITLTDKKGNKYKITAEITVSDKNILTLKNSDGEMEVFKK